jgi:hypothetical protein
MVGVNNPLPDGSGHMRPPQGPGEASCQIADATNDYAVSWGDDTTTDARGYGIGSIVHAVGKAKTESSYDDEDEQE